MTAILVLFGKIYTSVRQGSLMWIPGSEATDVTLSGFGSDVCASW
jgi:hypothetical protein